MSTTDIVADFVGRYGAGTLDRVLAFADQVISKVGNVEWEQLAYVAPIFGLKLMSGSARQLHFMATAIASDVPSCLLVQWSPAKRPAERVQLTTLTGGKLDLQTVRLGTVVLSHDAPSTQVERTPNIVAGKA